LSSSPIKRPSPSPTDQRRRNPRPLRRQLPVISSSGIISSPYQQQYNNNDTYYKNNSINSRDCNPRERAFQQMQQHFDDHIMPQFEHQSRLLVNDSQRSLIPYCDNRDNSDSSDCDYKIHCDSSSHSVSPMPRQLPVPVPQLWRYVFDPKTFKFVYLSFFGT